jgi:hypothetical protein
MNLEQHLRLKLETLADPPFWSERLRANFGEHEADQRALAPEAKIVAVKDIIRRRKKNLTKRF